MRLRLSLSVLFVLLAITLCSGEAAPSGFDAADSELDSLMSSIGQSLSMRQPLPPRPHLKHVQEGKAAEVRAAAGRRHRKKLGESAIMNTTGPLTRVYRLPQTADFLPINDNEFSKKAEELAALVESLVPQSETAKSTAEENEVAAVELEKKARVIGDTTMKFVQEEGLKESKWILKRQDAARAAKDDFFDAVKANGNVTVILAELADNVARGEAAMLKAKAEVLDKLEEYDRSSVKARGEAWEVWIAKDRKAHAFQRVKDEKNIKDYIGFYTSSELKTALATMNQLATTSNNKIMLATEAKKAAEEADEENQMMLELKETQEKLRAARDKQREHQAKIAAEQAQQAAEASEKKQAKAEAKAEAEAAGGNSSEPVDLEEQRAEEQKLLSETLETADLAMFSAKKAAEQAEKNRKEAEAMEAAVERMDKSIERKGKLKARAAAALEAENLARDAQVKLAQKSANAYKAMRAAHGEAHKLKIQMQGENWIGKQAAVGTVKVETWLKVTKADIVIAKRNRERAEKKLKEKKAAEKVSKKQTQAAYDAVQRSRKNVRQSEVAVKKCNLEIEGVKKTRRQAWRSAHRAHHSNLILNREATDLMRLGLELNDAAVKKTAESQRLEKFSKDQLDHRKNQVVRADGFFKASQESGDFDAKVAAQKAQVLSAHAVVHAQEALAATMVVVDHMKSQVANEMGRVTAMNSAATEIGNADVKDTGARERANAANLKMQGVLTAEAKAARFFAQSKEELAEGERTYALQLQLRKEKEQAVVDAQTLTEQKDRYIVHANETAEVWRNMVDEAESYARNRSALGLQKVQDWKGQVLLAENASDFTQSEFDKSTQAMRLIDGQFEAIQNMSKAAGMTMMYKLAEMQKKWALIYLEESKLNAGAWEVLLKDTEKPIKDALATQEAWEKNMLEYNAQQDWRTTKADAIKAQAKVDHAASILRAEKRRKEFSFAESQLDRKAKSTTKLQKLEAKAESKRRTMALKALTKRVEEQWRMIDRLAISPLALRRLEDSQFMKIVDGWDRDGTPVGPGKMDNWILASLKELVDQYETKPRYLNQMGQEVITAVPGHLNAKVISRCSAACEPYAEMECSTGIVGEACTRGQVFRARFKYLEQYDDAEADWFICRCNGGVMQFASTESFEAERQIGKVMGVHYAPDDMQFSVRLHDQELLPAKWVDCWVGFREWLTTKTDFVESRNMTEMDRVIVRQTFLNWTADATNPLEVPFAELERLMLNQTAEPTYLEMRKKWQRECVGLPETPQWEARSFLEPNPTENWPGATDSAVDFFHLTNTSATSLSPYDWPTKSTWFHNISAEYTAKANIPVEASTPEPEPLNDSPEPGPLDGQDASGAPQQSDNDQPPEEVEPTLSLIHI